MRAWEAPNGGHAAIVALGLTIFALFGFDNTDEARFDEAATESGFIQQDECVERIAILGHGPGNRTEIALAHFRRHHIARKVTKNSYKIAIKSR